MSAVLGEAAMLAWGWRIPFLFAGVLGMIAIYIRLKLEDSPEFLAIVAAGESSKAPLRETMTWGRALMLVFCIITVHASIFYLVLTYASTFLGEMLQFSGTVRFWFIISACVLAAAVMPIGGIMSDKWGRKPVLLVSGVAATLSMLWFFLAAPGATPVSFFFPLVACALSFGFYASSTYATMTELLPTKIRSTGIAVAYNLPVAIFGGSAPLIAAWFISATGDITSPWYFFVGTGVVSLAALLVLRRDDFTKAEQVQAISANKKSVTEVA